jgi:hypothetical protein
MEGYRNQGGLIYQCVAATVEIKLRRAFKLMIDISVLLQYCNL